MEIKFMKLIILSTDGSAPIAEEQLKHIITTGIVASLCGLKGYTAVVKDLPHVSDTNVRDTNFRDMEVEHTGRVPLYKMTEKEIEEIKSQLYYDILEKYIVTRVKFVNQSRENRVVRADLRLYFEKIEAMTKTADDYRERMMEGARQLGLQSAKNARLELELKRTREQLFDEYESYKGAAGAQQLMDEFDKQKPPSNG